MIAAVLTRPKKTEVKQTAVPAVAEQDIKVRVEGCGVCASSIPLWEGRDWFSYPVEPGMPGHEGWGVVEEVGGRIAGIQPGDRVAFLSNHAFAEYDITNQQSCIKLPPSLSAGPFPAEPLGCAMNIFERSRVSSEDTVAIIGAGFLGLLLCQLCKHAGAKVIAISKRDFSLQEAQRFGAEEVIQLDHPWNVSNKVAEITKGTFCTRVIEATGKQEGLDIATEIVAEYGLIIIAGYHQDGLRNVNVQKWNWKAIDVINAHERNPQRYLHGMKRAVEAVSAGVITPGDLYTDVLALDQLDKAFEMTSARPDGFIKALIKIN